MGRSFIHEISDSVVVLKYFPSPQQHKDPRPPSSPLLSVLSYFSIESQYVERDCILRETSLQSQELSRLIVAKMLLCSFSSSSGVYVSSVQENRNLTIVPQVFSVFYYLFLEFYHQHFSIQHLSTTIRHMPRQTRPICNNKPSQQKYSTEHSFRWYNNIRILSRARRKQRFPCFGPQWYWWKRRSAKSAT